MGQPECCQTPYHVRVKRVTTRLFRQYGELVGRNPVPFIVMPVIIFGALGLGTLLLESEEDTEKLYFPRGSRALADRDRVMKLFPDRNRDNYNMFAQNVYEEEGMFIFQPKDEADNIFSPVVVMEIQGAIHAVTSLEVNGARYDDFCAAYDGKCVITGAEYVSPRFLALLAAGNVTYPLWVDPETGRTRNLSFDLADVTTLPGGILKEARVLKTNFMLARNLTYPVQWQMMFLNFAQNYLRTNYTKVSYKIFYSLGIELDKATKSDLYLFALAIALVVVYSLLVTAGGDAVSTRFMLALAGVLAAALSIVGSVGFLSLCGFKFANIVGIMPYLIIGIGVDDMFLIMSSWSELTQDQVMPLPRRIGATLALAGVGITVTSLTDLLAFLVGSTSVFYCVQSFCLYTGIAVVFCYINNITLFVGCLAVHARRVYSARHFLTCRPTKPRDQLVREGRSRMYAFFCGGSVPKSDRDDESFIEKLPRSLLPKVIVNPIVRVVILLGFACLLAVSLYGVVNLKQGIDPKNLVSTNSYLHRYINLKEYYFPDRLPIAFVIDREVNYSRVVVQNQLRKMLTLARRDPGVDSGFERCWLMSYVESPYYSETNFTFGLTEGFLPTSPTFLTDVVFDESGENIIASRCYVLSLPLCEQYDQARLMTRVRSLADASSLPVFAFHYSFVTFEQYLAILPATVTTVGCAVVAMVVVCLIFLPHPLMVFLVTLNIFMILCGIFGFMYFWDITLSSITMIMLIMSVGFSVDFSAHVCSSYLMSNAATRSARASDAIKHAASPIFNGGISSLVGVVLLLASDTYIFITFFKIIFLVIIFGVLNAVLFMPVVLSLIGPENKLGKEDTMVAYVSKDNQANVYLLVNKFALDSSGDRRDEIINGSLLPAQDSLQREVYATKTDTHTPDSGCVPNGSVFNGSQASVESHPVMNGAVPQMNGAVSSQKSTEDDSQETDSLLNESMTVAHKEHGVDVRKDASTSRVDGVLRLSVPNSFNRHY